MGHRAFIVRLGNGVFVVGHAEPDSNILWAYPGAKIEYEQTGMDEKGAVALAKTLSEFSNDQLEKFIKSMKIPAEVIVFGKKEKK
jgi:nickel-dependent lactate racemase